MRHRLVFAASVLLSLISTGVLAASQTFTTLDPPNSSETLVLAISANGTIVGYYQAVGSEAYQSFVINPAGNYGFPEIPFAYSTEADAVNNAGSTIGYYYSQGDLQHEYAMAGQNGKVDFFDPPRAKREYTRIGAINNLNEVTGVHTDSHFVEHGFTADLFGTLTVFDAPGAVSTVGISINDSGVVAGGYFTYTGGNPPHAFVRDQVGNITTFDAPGAGTEGNQGTEVTAINSVGQIAGYYGDSNSVYHGFLRGVDGTVTEFDAPDAAGFGTFALGINSAGQVAGYYFDSNEGAHGFLRDQHGNITEFDDPNAGTAQNEGTYSFGISDTGVIAGFYIDGGGIVHGFKRK
jgi:hypothetical protein